MPQWHVAVFSPCAGTHFWWMTSQKRGRHTVAQRGRSSALARRSPHSAFLGTSAKVVSKIVSPRFCSFRPRRRVSAAPSRCARKPVKTPLKKQIENQKRQGLHAPRWRGAHSGSRHTCAAPSWHGPNTTWVCRRSQILRIYWAVSTHACATSSRDGATAAFLTGRRSKLRTGTLFNFHAKDGSVNRVV